LEREQQEQQQQHFLIITHTYIASAFITNGVGIMDSAIQSSVYVSSPEFAGWLLKRGFHVINLNKLDKNLICMVEVAKAVEDALGCFTWRGDSIHG